jgi:dolichol-phosphate mannosyltransferase
LEIPFDENYLRRMIAKYYLQRVEKKKLLSIIVPTYFQEKGIQEFYSRTKKVLNSLEQRYFHEMIFINDGSTDKTLELLIDISKEDNCVKVLNFSRNFGNQIAITAGIDKAVGDGVVIIDDDLQDPPEVILNFIAKWEEGFKVVYGVRKKRKGHNFVFLLIAKLYYRFIELISDIKIPVDTGDFRLVDKKVIEQLKLMREENRYLRGMVSWVGFSQIGWNYERDARYAGKTTFTLKKYINFAFNGITSFSEKPLHFSSYIGLFITIIGLFAIIAIIIVRIVNPGSTIQGWSSLSAMLLFFGGVQLLSIGVVGLYISKIFKEIKRRPLYIIEELYEFNSINHIKNKKIR